MLFWIVAALLTLGASLAVLVPLARRTADAPAPDSHDIEVYRDQLAELDRDAARGLIEPAEAEQARAEIARRILSADDQTGAQAAHNAPGGRAFARIVGTVAILTVPLVSWGIYAAVGSPNLPSQPLAARLAKNPADSSVDELVARAEAHLTANPDDARGWDVLAPIYLRLGRYAEAVNAYRSAIRLDGASAARESGLGEAIAGAGGGLVSAEAQQAFGRALALDPRQPKARFYLATALAQEGRTAEAVTSWQAMLADLPPESAWRQATSQAIARASEESIAADGAPQPRGPTQEQIANAADMSEADRNAMIRTMVAGLDARLRQTPTDPEGWAQLVRSHVMLGDRKAARDALERGSAALGRNTAEAKGLGDFAGTLGLSAID